jgi:sec-independent protein translocase protein TatC
VRQNDESVFENSKMTFGEHLEELRAALLKAVAALVIGFLVALLFAGNVVEYVQTPLKAALSEYYRDLAEKEYRQNYQQLRAEGSTVPDDIDAAAALLADEGLVAEERFVNPREALAALAAKFPDAIDVDSLPPSDPKQPVDRANLVPLRIYHSLDDDPRVRVIGLAVHEPFSVYIRAAMVLGAVLASPFVFYFIWQFVAAGLYPHEQRHVRVFLPVSLGLFLAGVSLAFFAVLGFVLSFLFSFYSWMGLDPDPRISDWMTFVLILPLGFGISFQLPLVMLFLERIGALSVATYLANWRIAVLVICVLSMIFTPTDPWSMILLATPLTALYFLGIAMCRMMPRPSEPFGEQVD